MSSRAVFITLLAVMWLGVTSPRLHAAPLERELSKLLEASKKNTPSAIATTRAQYDRLKKLRPNDAKIDYAYGVALLHQKRYKEGLPLVAGYAVAHPSEQGPQLTHIWALLQNRQYTEALTVAARLSECFSEPPAEANLDELSSTARGLGQVLGFLDRARTGAIEPEVKSRRTSEILSRLGEHYLTDFNTGRQDVTDQFKQLDQERQAKIQQRSDQAEEQKQKLQEALEGGQDRAAASLEAIESTESRLQDATRELMLVQHQVASLQQDRTQLAAQIAVVQSQLSQLLATNVTSNFSDLRVDPNAETITTNTTSRTADYNRRIAAEPWLQQLSQLNRQAFSMDRRLVAMQARAVQLGGQSQQQSAVISSNEKELKSSERRAKMLEKQVRKLENQKPEKASVLPAKMTALSTYIPFPFEDEKARILGWFAK